MTASLAVPDQAGRLRVLFLCTGNSARSILAEAALNALGAAEFDAISAGSHPTGRVNPAALALLSGEGIATTGLRSKSWDEFTDGPPIDIVITVCDAAAGESCPVMPGRPPSAHWGIPDPATAARGEVEDAFRRTWQLLHARIAEMVATPLAGMTAEERCAALAGIAARHPA